MEDIRVESWQELQDRLFEGSWQEPMGRFRSHFAFRGMPQACDDLRTGLQRMGDRTVDREGHMLRNFRKYASRDAVPTDSVWHWLALAQHHGLPTRLLDWSFSPYVALHFATDNLEWYRDDGVVWQVDYVETNARLPEGLKAVLEEEGSDVFTAEMLNGVAANVGALRGLSEEDFVLFYEPPSLDDRIVNQFALFSLMSSVRIRLDEWLSGTGCAARRLAIPAGLKWEIRDKLDQANITERVLFPGLDGLCRWLTRYYSPRSATDNAPVTAQGQAQPS